MSTTDDYVPPPEGWFDFGTHVLSPDVRLEFSEEVGEDGIPRWERPLPEVAPTPEKAEEGALLVAYNQIYTDNLAQASDDS